MFFCRRKKSLAVVTAKNWNVEQEQSLLVDPTAPVLTRVRFGAGCASLAAADSAAVWNTSCATFFGPNSRVEPKSAWIAAPGRLRPKSATWIVLRWVRGRGEQSAVLRSVRLETLSF